MHFTQVTLTSSGRLAAHALMGECRGCSKVFFSFLFAFYLFVNHLYHSLLISSFFPTAPIFMLNHSDKDWPCLPLLGVFISQIVWCIVITETLCCGAPQFVLDFKLLWKLNGRFSVAKLPKRSLVWRLWQQVVLCAYLRHAVFTFRQGQLKHPPIGRSPSAHQEGGRCVCLQSCLGTLA